MRKHYNGLFETAKTIIPKTMKYLDKENNKKNKFQTNLLEQYMKYKVFYYWGEIIGKDMAKHITPQEIKFSLLYVYASSSVWANSFQYLKLDIIQKINKYLGYNLIKDIQFTRFKNKQTELFSSILEKKVNLGSYLKRVPITNEELNETEIKLKNITDKDLYNKLKSIYLKNLQLKKLKEQYGWINCKKCGRLTPPNNQYCYDCTRVIRQHKENQIISILLEIPWAKYQDIVQYVDCTLDMVNKERLKLVQILASRLIPDKDFPDNDSGIGYYSMEAKTVVMLYKSITPEQLNNAVLKDVFYRLRYDTAYWNNKKYKNK